MYPRLIILFAALAQSSLAQAQSSNLTVNLAPVKDAKGSIRVGLYQDPKTFRKEAQAFSVQQVPAAPGSVQVRFTQLPPGRYAIMAYHDENGDGELNRRLGMFPTEGYGLSNNPKVMGPPQFEDSAFTVPAPGDSLSIELRY